MGTFWNIAEMQFLWCLHFRNTKRSPFEIQKKCFKNITKQCFFNISEMISYPWGNQGNWPWLKYYWTVTKYPITWFDRLEDGVTSQTSIILTGSTRCVTWSIRWDRWSARWKICSFILNDSCLSMPHPFRYIRSKTITAQIWPCWEGGINYIMWWHQVIIQK